VEMAASALQFAAGALIVTYTVWKVSSPWEKEAMEVALAVAGLRLVKELLNIASPLIEIRRQPAQFDRNDDCVRQVRVCMYVCMYACMIA
jgi:hypothetical protein